MNFSLPSSSRRILALEFAIYALLTAFALHATWLTWPDDLIDFSRELPSRRHPHPAHSLIHHPHTPAPAAIVPMRSFHVFQCESFSPD